MAEPVDASSLTIVFAGGGSGGHLFPALAVDVAIREAFPSAWIKYFCSDRPIDAAILDRAGADYETIPSESSAYWRRPWRVVFRNWRGYRQAKSRLKELQADCVIGCGGFASVPAVLAARSLGIPIMLLEQNVTPGRATNWLAKHADAICVSFPETGEHFQSPACRVEVTGNPVRASIARLTMRGVESKAGSRQILILGGSLGSRTMNSQIVPALLKLSELLNGWSIVHQAGQEDAAELSRQYAAAGIPANVVPFLHAIEEEYPRSELAVCRAGAGTLSELACAGLPAVLIPFAAAKDDHQTANARWYSSRGAAECIETNTVESLPECLERLLTSDETRARMASAMRELARPDAAIEVASLLLNGVLSSPFAPRK